MDEFTITVLGGIVLVLGLLMLAYLIWPTNRDEGQPRNTTSSKNSRGYWE